MVDVSEDLLSISFNKEQWDKVYKWFLTVKEVCEIDEGDIEVAEQIVNTLVGEYGDFK
ncbi:hypothetical protein V1503_19200 [Bacillus sp. SCS-151]|uniref:hypothetical protein n=1 Tax=Nanhaiella sioensis TaxID=3115293 RepID=UPI00397A2DBF